MNRELHRKTNDGGRFRPVPDPGDDIVFGIGSELRGGDGERGVGRRVRIERSGDGFKGDIRIVPGHRQTETHEVSLRIDQRVGALEFRPLDRRAVSRIAVLPAVAQSEPDEAPLEYIPEAAN
jgi:hypothetical protein